MALPAPTNKGSQGQTTMRPNFQTRLLLAGDASYPAGGYAMADYLKANLSITPTVLDIRGYGKTAGGIDHYVDYDIDNDKLKLYVLATGAEVAGATDVSSVALDLVLTYS